MICYLSLAHHKMSQNVTEHKELLMSLLLSWKNFKLINMLIGVAMTFEGSELTSLHIITRAEARSLVIKKSDTGSFKKMDPFWNHYSFEIGSICSKHSVYNKNARSVDLSLFKSTEDLSHCYQHDKQMKLLYFFSIWVRIKDKILEMNTNW